TSRIVWGRQKTASGFQRQRIDETASASVIRSNEPLKLLRLLTIWTCYCVTDHIPGETVITSVHDVCLVPVLRRQELKIKTSFTFQCFRNGFIKVNGNLHAFTFGSDNHTGIEIIIGITQRCLYCFGSAVNLTV